MFRDNFPNLRANIAAKFSVRRVSEKAGTNLLMERACERYVVEKLKSGDSNGNDIDHVWRNLHDYPVSLLLERLKNELLQ